MCDMERTRFFRPWNLVEEVGDDEEVATSTNIPSPGKDEEEEQDRGSVVSSACSTPRHYNSSENDSSSRRSCSVSSEDMNNAGSLGMLSNFVLSAGCHEKSSISSSGDEEPRCSAGLSAHHQVDGCYSSASSSAAAAAAAAAAEWSNAAASGFYHPAAGYQNYHQANWPAAAAAAAYGTVEYAWLPGNYESMHEAVHRLSHQDAVAKQIKKLRPKKFRCHYCNVAFSNNGQLKGHLRIHTGNSLSV